MAGIGGDLFKLVTRVSIQSELLSSPADLDLKLVGDNQFFHCAKSCRKVMRVMMCKAAARPPPADLDVSKTDIVEQLSGLKDTAFQHAYACVQRGGMTEEASRDLGLETPTKTSRGNRYTKVALMQMPDVLLVHAPSILDVEGCDLLVTATKPGGGLWVELSNKSLTYITLVVDAQLQSGGIKRNHPSKSVPHDDRVVVDVPGVSYSYKRGVYQATALDSADKRVRRFVKDENQAVEFVQSAAPSAP